jgi:hypothetical protein
MAVISKIILRNDTSANWTTNNPVLAEGEMGYATDLKNFKIGNGTDTWTALKYADGTILSKSVDIADFTGKDGYIMAYNETSGTFYLKKDEGSGGGGFLSRTFAMSNITFNSLNVPLTATTITKPV